MLITLAVFIGFAFTIYFVYGFFEFFEAFEGEPAINRVLMGIVGGFMWLPALKSDPT